MTLRQVVRYMNFTIPDKLRCETRISFDEVRGAVYNTTNDGEKGSSIRLYPLVSLAIIRPDEIDENGNRTKAPWHKDDSIGMNKYALPIFIDNFKEMQKGLRTPELYTYHGKRLEINETIAESIRKAFPVGNQAAVEISAAILTVVNSAGEEERVEGVKLKYNNEQHVVYLTLNEITSLIFNLDHLDLDSLAFQMYQAYTSKPDKSSTNITLPQNKPMIDIKPVKNVPLDIPTDDEI